MKKNQIDFFSIPEENAKVLAKVNWKKVKEITVEKPPGEKFFHVRLGKQGTVYFKNENVAISAASKLARFINKK